MLCVSTVLEEMSDFFKYKSKTALCLRIFNDIFVNFHCSKYITKENYNHNNAYIYYKIAKKITSPLKYTSPLTKGNHRYPYIYGILYIEVLRILCKSASHTLALVNDIKIGKWA